MAPQDPTLFNEHAEITRERFLKYGLGALGAATLLGPAGVARAGLSLQGASAAGGTIKIGMSDYLGSDSIDPVLALTTFALVGVGMLHDTLVHIDQQWRVTPMLASSWVANKTSTQYTFRLRQGVEFHSGKTLDANDVAATMRRVLDPKVGSFGGTLFSPVLSRQGIKVLDKRTIRFNLKVPDVFFLVKMGFWYGRIHQAGWDFKKGSGGTGPFVSQSFQAGQGFEFVRNENYWQSGLPLVDGVNAVIISEPSTKAQAVLNGDFDLTDPPDFAAIPQLERAKNISVLKGPFGFAQDFGLAATKKPYDDPQVRTALRMLIDRDKFVKIVCRGQGVAGADTPINPRDPFFPQGLRPTPYDPEQARSILKKAGHGDGWTDTIFTAPTFKGLNDSSVFLKQAWEAGGIKLNVKSLTVDGWAKHLQKTDGLVANYWARQHPSTMLAFMCSSKGVWNESFVKDPKIDKLLATAQSTKSVEKQKEAFGEAQRLYIAQSPTLWTSHYADYWPYQKRLSGVVLSPTDLVDFRRARLA